MNRWIAVFLLLVLVGCGSDEDKPAGGFDLKEDVSQRNDGVDYCDQYDWYGDGECDEFCTNPDPDCSVNSCADVECCVDLPHPEGCCQDVLCTPPPVCPDESNPAVTYVSQDDNECALIDFGCPNGEGFSIEGCGCGCIDDSSPVACPGPDAVAYVPGSRENYSICEQDDWGCSPDAAVFDDPDCGCGCYADPVSCYEPSDPNVEYVASSPTECNDIDFECAPDEFGFSDSCGCGCVGRSECLDSDDPTVEYVGKSPDECAVIFFACDADEDYFQNDCGCGCVRTDTRPDYCESPLLSYVSTDIDRCARIDYTCNGGSVGFSHPECGCGCYADPRTCVEDVDCKPGYCDLPPVPIYNNQGGAEPPTPVCYPTECTDDENPVLCDATRPVCNGARVAVARDGCWKCVNPRTCE